MKVLGTILRFLFSWLDSVVANLITTVYDLLLNLSNLILYSDNIVKTLGKRIGLILGIFMLFRIAITLVNYLISPDQVKDSSKGFKKLFANIFISLALLATVNHIFDFAYKLQLEVVNSNIIGKIFFGAGNSTSLKDDGTEVIGPDADIGYYLYSGFFTPNTDEAGLKYCESMWDVESKVDDRCSNALDGFLGRSAYNNIWKARQNRNLSIVFSDYDIVLAKGVDGFVFDYLPIISTAAGVVTVLIMISFCMDLATRAVKLLFLQIIAPIPIIANMDPSKGKDMFSKWYKECFKTYLSVFLRLIAINFAVFMITLIYGNFKGMFSGNPLLSVFIIIGCLMFAKQAPKLLEDMFGIKSDGMVLNPLKKFEEQALFGKNITGLAAGATMGTIGTFTHAGRGRFLTGAFGGLFSGKGLTETWKNQASVNSRMRTARLDGSSFGGRLGARVSNFLGTGGELADIERQKHAIQDELDGIDRDIKVLDDKKAKIKGKDEYIERQDKLAKNNAVADLAVEMKKRSIEQVKKGQGSAGKIYNEMNQLAASLEKVTTPGFYDIVNSRGEKRNVWVDNAQQAAAYAEEVRQSAESFVDGVGWQSFATEASHDSKLDATLSGLQRRFDDAYQQTIDKKTGKLHEIIDHKANDYGELLNGALGEAKGRITDLQIEGTVDERAIAEIDSEISHLNGKKQAPNDRMRDLSRRESEIKANQSAVGGNK